MTKIISPTFSIGDIVTIKSHPLAFESDGTINCSVNHIPPFMCVKEIHIEYKKHKYSSEFEGLQVHDNVKYLCVYFNQYRMQFEEKFVYEKMLVSLSNVKFHSDYDNKEENYLKLVDETKQYPAAKYEFGKRVFFKTYKLEKRKKFKKASGIDKYGKPKFDHKSKNKNFLTHTSPAFVLSGIKKNNNQNIANEKYGGLSRKTADVLYKVTWYNSYQEKFSEEYMPKEFFTDNVRIYEDCNSLKKPAKNTFKNSKLRIIRRYKRI